MPFSWLGGIAANATGSGIAGPIEVRANYAAFWADPCRIPDISALVQMFTQGAISKRTLKEESYYLGYDLTKHNQVAPRLLVEAPNHTYVWNDQWFASLKNVTCAWVEAQQNTLNNEEIREAYYRQMIGRNTAEKLLHFGGYKDPLTREAYLRLGEQIPGPSDLIRFAVREAFTPAIVSLYHYQDELPMAVLPWMQKQGFGGDTGIPRPAGIDGNGNPLPAGNATWFDLFWWSHWELPSVSEGYTMAQRLYPQSRFGPSPLATPNTVFTQDDLSTLLKTNDYPTYWRERLEAISYNPLSRVDVRRMFQYDVIDDAGVYHAYRSQGYNDQNATLLLNYAKKAKQLANIKLTHVKTKQQVYNYYKAGIIDANEAKRQFQELGIDLITADTIITEITQELQYEDFEATLKAVKKGFMEGLLSTDQTRELLIGAGLYIGRANQYLAVWETEKKYLFRDNSTGEITKAYQLSIIDENEMTARLFNLHYTSKQVSLIVATAVREKQVKFLKDVSKAQVADAKAADKASKEQQKAADKARKDADKAAKAKTKAATDKAKADKKAQADKVKRLLAAYTEKNIIAMHKAGVLPEDQVRSVLADKGWSEKEINKWVATYITETSTTGATNATPKSKKNTPPTSSSGSTP